eukprot:g63584.t1
MGTPGTRRPHTSVGRPGGKSRAPPNKPAEEEEPERIAIVDMLLEAGASLAVAEETGGLLITAKRKGYAALALRLLELGVRVLPGAGRDEEFFTLLKWAVQKNHTAFATNLLTLEKDIPSMVFERKDFVDRTVLELALMHEVLWPVAEVLCDLGASFQGLTAEGRGKFLKALSQIEKKRGMSAAETKLYLLAMGVQPAIAAKVKQLGLTAGALKEASHFPHELLKAVKHPNELQPIAQAMEKLSSPKPPAAHVEL